jgi:hypothetical protein
VFEQDAVSRWTIAAARVIVLGVMSRSLDEKLVKDAVMEGPAGEARLVEMLDSVRGFSRVVVVAALGDAQGMQGIPVLRRLLATPQRSVDLRCAALLAFAKRAGAAASDVLTAHLDGPPAVARYAAIGLAGVGDERAWSQVHLRLTRQLDRARPTFQLPEVLPGCAAFEVLITVAYLVRHLDGSARERTPKLVVTLRSRFDRLYEVERDWLVERWPGIAPDGPPADGLAPPDSAPFRRLVYATHLFDPVY